MERKIIKQGLGGYTIYLPKGWISERKLDGGDVVNISEQGSKLIIGGEDKKNSSIEIILDDENRSDLEHILTHLYRAGADSIKFLGCESRDVRKIREVVQKLMMGFEITSKEDNVLIESVSESAEDKYPMMIKRIFLIIEEQHRLTEETINGSFSDYDEMQSLRNDLDKFVLFCRRLLTKQKAGLFPRYEWELLTSLMHISHSYYYLYEYGSKNKISKIKEISSLFSNLSKYLGWFIESHKNNSISQIHKINDKKNKLHFSSCLKILEKGKSKENVIVMYIREIFRNIQLGTSPLLSIILSSEFSRD